MSDEGLNLSFQEIKDYCERHVSKTKIPHGRSNHSFMGVFLYVEVELISRKEGMARFNTSMRKMFVGVFCEIKYEISGQSGQERYRPLLYVL